MGEQSERCKTAGSEDGEKPKNKCLEARKSKATYSPQETPEKNVELCVL